MEPLQTQIIWEKLHKASFWAQNGGPATWGAISAIDIACWDIKGKFFNVPVTTLLGGTFRTSLRTYASQLQGGWCNKRLAVGKTEDYAYWAQVAVEQGYDALKYDFFTFDRDGRRYVAEETTRLQPAAQVDLVRERCQAVREAVGHHVDLIVENHAYNLHDYNKQLCLYDLQPERGRFEVPDRPGIGNELNDYPFSHSERVTVQ